MNNEIPHLMTRSGLMSNALSWDNFGNLRRALFDLRWWQWLRQVYSTRIYCCRNNLQKNAHSASSIFHIWPTSGYRIREYSGVSLQNRIHDSCPSMNTRDIIFFNKPLWSLNAMCVWQFRQGNWDHDEETSDLIINTRHPSFRGISMISQSRNESSCLIIYVEFLEFMRISSIVFR